MKKCNFCGNSSSIKNYARHKKSKICSVYQNAVKSFNEILLEDKCKIKSLSDLLKKPYTSQDGKIIYLSDSQLKFINKIKYPDQKFG